MGGGKPASEVIQTGSKRPKGGKGQNPRKAQGSCSTNFGRQQGNLQGATQQQRRPFNAREDRDPPTQKEIQEMRNLLGIMKTLILRQETQQTILRQDTGFMLTGETTRAVTVPHRPAVARHQEGGPIGATGSHAGGAVSAPRRDHQGKLPGHYEDALLARADASYATNGCR